MNKNSNSLALPTRKLMLRALTGALHVTMCDAASLMHHWCRPSAVHKLSFTPTPECQSLWMRTVSKRNWKQKHKSDKRANKHNWCNSYNLIRNHYPKHSRQSFLACFCSILDRVLLFGREVYFVWQSFITLLVSVELAGTLYMYNVQRGHQWHCLPPFRGLPRFEASTLNLGLHGLQYDTLVLKLTFFCRQFFTTDPNVI